MYKRSALIVCLAVLLQMFFLASVSWAQFQPPQTGRVKVSLNQNWLYYGTGDWAGIEDPAWHDSVFNLPTVHLPHNFQKVTISGGAYKRGIGCYRKHFTLDASYTGKRITVYFEGAMTVARVWINGTALTTHYGGFSPFCYDITQYCNFGGADNLLVVKLDNSYQNLVPPEKPDGSSVDFEMFGGIYRNVWLIATSLVFVPEGVHAWANSWANQGGHFITTPTVSAGSATVVVRTWVKNATAASVNVNVVTTITDASNTIVATNTSAAQAIAANVVFRYAQSITVSSPTLWYPWNPYRYTVHTVVYNGTTAVDYYYTKIGIRQIQFTRTTGAFINGTYHKLLGLNRHQMWPFVGNAVPDIQQRRDAEMLKDARCTMIRCSHYQQADAFINACDSLGLMVWEEIPGWHCCNNGGHPSTDATWRARHFDALKAMVRSLRNHPSIVLWAPAINEAISDPTIERPLNDTCHKEDSSRMTSAARAGWQHPSGAGSNIYDVYGDNQFTPGSIPTSNPDPNTYGYINTEHTGHTYEGYSRRQTNTESDLLSHAWMHARMTGEARDRGNWVLGGMGWCMFDYYTGGSIRYHGAMDLMHIPKFCYYFYKSQSASDNYSNARPFVKITNWYRSASPVNRDVYHNCEQIRLYRNGTLIGTQGPATTLNLYHCPTTFTNVTFATGMLTAEGLIGGVVVARDTARTPGAANCIRLIADPPVIEANGGDFSRVEAWIIDAVGTYVPYTSNSITFNISGTAGGTLVGDNPIAAQSGACIILAKAGLTPGTMTVSATSSGLCTPAPSVTITVSQATSVYKPVACPPIVGTFQPSVRVINSGLGTLKLEGMGGNNRAQVALYDLSGKLIYKTITSKKVLALSSIGCASSSIRIMKIEKIAPTR